MRKKFLLMFLVLSLFSSMGGGHLFAQTTTISSVEDLVAFAESVNGGTSYEGQTVTLTTDLTLSGEWTPIGNGSRSSKTYTGNSFKGIFDGGDHAISGLTITSTSGANAAVGLFGIVDGGTVKNLKLTDVNINVPSSNLAGAAIGMMLNNATAANITVSGAIVGNDGVGGIVGRMIINGTIANCINNASVTTSYGGIGGIVGKPYYDNGSDTSDFATITNCINNGTITAGSYAGGIAGLARANVTDCVNNGEIKGGTQTGGIIGQLIAAGTVSGNENKGKVSGTNHVGGIIGSYTQTGDYNYYDVTIANNINRGEIAATQQCAAILGVNNIDGFTAMTATGNVSYYYVEGLEMFGNPEDMVIDATNEFIIPVAKIGEQTFYTFAEAAAAAQTGSEIILLADATVEGTLALPAGIKLTSNGHTINGSIRMLGDLELNGALTITGGLWVGKSGETLTATLSGDKLTASYFMFQRGTYTINADIDAVYGYLSFEGTFEVNSTIHTTGANGEVLYIRGNVNLNADAVLDSDNSVFLDNDNAVLTLKPGSKVDSNVSITKSGAKLNIDATGMAAGASANITGTVTNSGNGTIAVVGNDNLEASIVDGKVVLAAKPAAKIGEQGYATLAAAYEAAVNGDVIVLNESVTTFPVIKKAVTFKGGKENAAVEINYALSQNFTAIDGIVRFENLTFNKPLFTEHGGNKPGLSIEFEGCNFNVNSEAGYGILIGTSWSNSVVKGLKVNNCNFKYVGTEFKGGYMLYVQCVNEVTITNNTIDGNNLYRGAIHLGDATEHATVATVSNNTIKNFCRGVMMGNRVVGSSATISGNTFDNINYSDKDSKPAQECAPIFIHSNATAEALQIALINNEVENCANPMIYSEDTDLIKYYVTEFTGNTVAGAAVELANSYNAPNQIFPVATINDAEYFTLQAAINAAVDGDVVTLLADNAENVTVTQKPDVKFTIDGADKTMTGTITIDGKSAAYATAGLTIKNVKFDANNIAKDASINLGGNDNIRYTNGVTVDNCTFTGTGKAKVAVKNYTGGCKNVTITNCTATGLHSLAQLKTSTTVTLTNNTVSECKNGVSLGSSTGVTVTGCVINVEGYGIRPDGGSSVVVTDSEISAFIPVVVRNATKDASLTFNGTNTFTATNNDGLWCAIGTNEYETNGQLPTAPTGNVTVTLNDTGLSMDGVYGEHFALNGEGTAESPYLINNLYELKGFRDDVNAGNNYQYKFVKLTADIDMTGVEWTPIGNVTYDSKYKPTDASKVFSGVFNGNGKVISNLKVASTVGGVDKQANVGLFGITGEGADIKDLTLTNVNIETDGRNVGALAGFAYKATLSNITVNGNIQIKGGNNVAGVAGMTRYYDMSATNISVSGANGSAIVGNNIVGGIFAEIAPNGSEQTFKNLSVENVAITGVSGVGGIVGLLTTGTVENVSVKNVALTGRTDYQGNAMGRIRLGSVAGLMGGKYATIANVTTENVTAKNLDGNAVVLPIIGANYDASSNATEAKIGDTYYATLQAALNAAVAGTGNITVEILEDIDLTNVDWNPVTVSAPGYPVVTVEGNGKTIKGLNDMLFAGTWAGGSGLIINNLTIANSNIVNDKDDAKGTVGVGAFIGFPQASATITLHNCHLKNSTVEGGHWTGGLIGMAGGYNGNDGPVFMNLTIEDCSVTGSIITGKGSCGGIIGHGSCAAWTAVNIQNTTVSGNTVTSTGSSTNKAGAVMGTIGAAGQPTTANGVTKTGGAMVAATVSGNTVTSGGTVITTIYGRQGTDTGILELNGGTYDNYPIEQNVAYAKPAAGLMIEQNEYGTYGLVPDPAYGKVAMIGETYYETLQDAVTVGGEVKVIANITLDQIVTVAVDKTVVLDLNGKTISTSAEETSYAINNLGTLTLKDSSEGKTGEVNARGIYNGYGDGGDNVASAKIIVESGTYNAKGTNGGGAAIFNYGIAEINGGTFTSVSSYSLNNREGAQMTIGSINRNATDNIEVKGGIYNTGAELTINKGDISNSRVGAHTVYAWDSEVSIIDGNIHNENSGNATIMAAGTSTVDIDGGKFTIKIVNAGSSYLLDAQNTASYDISGGEFTGGIRAQAGTNYNITGGTYTNEYGNYNVYPGGNIDIKGGTFVGEFAKAFAENNLADGFICEQNADGTYGVVEGLAGEGTEENPYLIKSLTDLTFFRDAVNNVNNGNTYAGKYIKLTANIDLAPTRSESNWTPIGNSTTAFQGTFDGDNHTISNLVINGGSSSNQGFFGFTTNGEIKNVIFNNAKVSGRLNVGVVAGTPYTSKYTNIKVTGHVEVNGMAYVGGVGGKNAYANWTDITVSVDETSYVNAYSVENGTAYRTYVGGVIGFNGEGGHTFKNITSNIKVIGSTKDVGGIFGILHYGNKAENVTFTGAVEAPADAKEVGGIAGVWHNEKGQTVTITNAKSEGTVKVGDVTTTGSIVGGAYNADNETADNSGSLIIDGNEAWLKVAQIGEAKYLTLHEAFNAATEGQTVTVINDVELESTVTIAAGKVVTLDLNGKTINYNPEVWTYGAANSGTALLTVAFGGDLTIKDSSTEKTGTIDASYTEEGWGHSTYDVYGAVMMTAAGDNAENGTAKLTVNGGTLKGFFAAVAGNRNRDNTEITINGGHLTAAISDKFSTTGIEHPMNGKLTINGGTIEGMDGISFRSGTLVITDGTIIGNAPTTAFDDDGYWDNNFAACTGHALQIVNRENYEPTNETPNVAISGGNFTSVNTTAVGSYASVNGDTPDTMIDKFITGGTYSSDVTEYLAPGYKAVQIDENVYEVRLSSFEKFYTAAGVETTSDNAAYSLSFTVTDYASKEVSVKIGNKNPAENKGCDLLIPSSVKFNDQDFAVTSIPVDGFNACKGFDKLVVPGTITSVSNSAFYNCSKLTEVVIEEGVQKLGSNTFYKISNLQTLTLPSTLTRIESLCFNGTHNIETIVCNAQTPPTAFNGSFTEAVYKNALLYVDGKYEDYKAANGWSNFNNILAVGATQTIDKDRYTLIATITDVWNRTCSVQIGTAPTNTKRAELAIPEHVSFSGIEFDITSIPEGGFQDCKYFEGTLTIPAYITSIGKNAFEGCSRVTALVVEEGVTSLGTSDTFNGCRNIETITLPSTLTKIPTRCFHNILQQLQVVECHALVPPTLASQFTPEAYNTATLYVHDVDAYKEANNWKRFNSIRLIGAVAQNKETEVEYKSIAEAVAAANAGETVQMLQNVNLENTITVAAGKEVVLDLNGKTVSYTTTEHKGEAMITNNGNLTITDSAEGGKLSYAYEGGADPSYGFGNSTIENKGVLTINAGTVENTSAAMSHASYAINTGAGATLNVEGGNILNLNGHAVRMVSFGTTLNTVNIEGGYIEGTRALQVQLPGSASATTKPEMNINITGGELKSNEENYNLAIYVYSNGQSAENVSVEISGGTFNGNVAVNAAATNSMPANAVAITDGTFNGDYGVFSYSDEDAAQAVISITGGTFATNNSEWYAEDDYYVFEENEDGTYTVVEQTIFTQTTQLSAGWNWFSAYVDIEGVHDEDGQTVYEGLTMIQNALGTNGIQIKKQGNFSTYEKDLETWFGNFAIYNKETLFINVAESQELTIVGEIVNPEDHTITLNPNWNWIGYPLNTTLLMSEAFEQAGLTPSDGDIVKHQDDFASYLYIDEEIKGWIGDFYMNPGEGFMYMNNSTSSNQLTYKYPTNSNNRSETRANVTTEVNHWTPNASQYPNNMTMMAMVDVEGGDYEVAAFVDGEVRGSARPIYVEALDNYMLFLTIHGEGVEEMTFKFYDLATGEESALNDRMNYSDNAIVGSLKEPYMFKRGTTGIGEASLSEINIYPNPTTTGKEINLQATCDKVEVFNALGVKVAEYQNVDSIDAIETAGIYVIRITNDSNVQNCRLVVK